MDRQEILLREYEACQSHVNSQGNLYWIVAGIFIAVNSAVLGGLASVILANETLLAMVSGISTKTDALPQLLVFSVIIKILGVGMILIVCRLMVYQRRITSVIRLAYLRMREIEAELGMWRGWLIHGLDNLRTGEAFGFAPEQIPDDMAVRLLRYHGLSWWQFVRERTDLYAPPRGFESIHGIFWILIAFWLVLIAGTALVDFRIWLLLSTLCFFPN